MLRRILLSVLLAAMAAAAIFIAPQDVTQTVTTTVRSAEGYERSEATERQSRLPRFLDWFSIGALLLTAWLWRRELGVSQLGPLGGPALSVTQEPAGGPPRPPEDAEPPSERELSAASAKVSDTEARLRIQHVLALFEKTHALNEQYLAGELRIPTASARSLLYSLVEQSVLRIDGFPKRTIFTPANSIENRTLNAVRRDVEKSHSVVRERRFVRTRDHREVDAIIETPATTFVVEAKILRQPSMLGTLERWVQQLSSLAQSLGLPNVQCILALACSDDSVRAGAHAQVARMTLDAGSVQVRVVVYSREDLEA